MASRCSSRAIVVLTREGAVPRRRAAARKPLVLAGRATFEGATPPLTGSEALDLADLARMAGEVGGRTITRQIIGEDAMRRTLRAAGLPASVLEIVLGYYRAARAGEFAAVDPTMQRLLGRHPRLMRDVLARDLRRP